MKFILTRDMCPVHYIRRDRDDGASVAFICPLPLGYKEVVTAKMDELTSDVAAIVRWVNEKAKLLEDPFKNLLLEYRDRDEQGQKNVLKLMQIRDFNLDHRGLYSVSVHRAEGDIYLSHDSFNNCDFVVDGFKEFFEPDVSWQCHNIDYYWQALLTREVVVQYFNDLQTLKERMQK